MTRNEIHAYAVLLGRKGGKSRARKHTKAELRKWGKLGGRPRKKRKKGAHKS